MASTYQQPYLAKTSSMTGNQNAVLAALMQAMGMAPPQDNTSYNVNIPQYGSTTPGGGSLKIDSKGNIVGATGYTNGMDSSLIGRNIMGAASGAIGRLGIGTGDYQQDSLNAQFRSIADRIKAIENAPPAPALGTGMNTGLDPTSVSQWFKAGTADPLMNTFEKTIKPKILESYAAQGGMFSSKKGDALQRALSDLVAQMTQAQAQTQSQAMFKNADLTQQNRQLAMQSALGLLGVPMIAAYGMPGQTVDTGAQTNPFGSFVSAPNVPSQASGYGISAGGNSTASASENVMASALRAALGSSMYGAQQYFPQT